MRILLATLDLYSHVTQAVPLVQRLVLRGHTVRWLVHDRFASVVQGAGATLLRPSSPSHAATPAMMLQDWVGMFQAEAGFQAADLAQAMDDETPDVLLVDPTIVGVTAANAYPNVLVGMLGCVPLLHIPAEVEFVLQASLPQMELPLPPQYAAKVSCIGPLLAPPTPGPPAPDLHPDRPLILITQGTLASDPELLIRPALEAFRNFPAQILATCAPLKDIPHNARCVPWVPFHQILPKAAVVVSAGGFATAQWCAAAGVPMVVDGKTEDKPDVGARVEWAGIGKSLCGAPTTPNAIRDAVHEVLLNPRYREQAYRLAAQCALQDSATLGLQVIEMTRARAVPNTEEHDGIAA